jgi:hypothetical protein
VLQKPRCLVATNGQVARLSFCKPAHRSTNTSSETCAYINQLLNAIREEQARGYCAQPDAGNGPCSGRPKDAHTIQKGGGLRAIAEQGHVVSSSARPTQVVANRNFLRRRASITRYNPRPRLLAFSFHSVHYYLYRSAHFSVRTGSGGVRRWYRRREQERAGKKVRPLRWNCRQNAET